MHLADPHGKLKPGQFWTQVWSSELNTIFPVGQAQTRPPPSERRHRCEHPPFCFTGVRIRHWKNRKTENVTVTLFRDWKIMKNYILSNILTFSGLCDSGNPTLHTTAAIHTSHPPWKIHLPLPPPPPHWWIDWTFWIGQCSKTRGGPTNRNGGLSTLWIHEDEQQHW